MSRPHLRWCDYDNEGNVLPIGYKRLRDGTIVDTKNLTKNNQGSNENPFMHIDNGIEKFIANGGDVEKGISELETLIAKQNNINVIVGLTYAKSVLEHYK